MRVVPLFSTTVALVVVAVAGSSQGMRLEEALSMIKEARPQVICPHL